MLRRRRKIDNVECDGNACHAAACVAVSWRAVLALEVTTSIGQEWFLVPLPVVEEVVERIKDGSISNYVFDVETASMKLRGTAS